MNIIKIGNEFLSANDIFKLHHQGKKFICAKCSSDLIAAFTKKDAQQHNIAPGIYCPKNLNHVNIHFNLKEENTTLRKLIIGEK